VERVLQRSEDITGDAIRHELTQLDLNLPMERLQFDQYGDPLYYRQVVIQIQRRQMVVVYPPERATGQAVYPAP
jgi:branched-chain amino acid transport system substrate-binding protein